MTKTLTTFTYLLCFTILLLGFTTCGENAIVKKAAEELDSKCPMQLDTLVRLNRVDFESPKTIVYKYTINFADNTSADLKAALKENLKTNLCYEIINKEQFKTIKEEKAKLKFIYKTSNGDTFMEFTLEPSFYQQKTMKFTDEEFEKVLLQSEIVINSQLPRLLGEGVRFDKIQYIAPRTIEYSYCLEQVDNDDLDDENIEKLKERVSSSIINAKDVEKMMKDNNAIFRFTYFDKNNTLITSFDVTPQQYK